MMFVTTAEQVIALDAATGALLWRYVHPLPPDARRPHPANRSVALYDDKVYVGTLDAHVVALEAATGQVAWDRTIADYRSTYFITMAPLVVNGMVMVGTSGGEHGVRGFVTALDATNGDEVWKRHTVPAPGEPGSETRSGDSWRTGGGPVWMTGTYDPALDITYWGVGNGGPWIGDDAATGELRDHYQYQWNGSWDWDWDEANAPLLVDIERDGRTIPALVHPGRLCSTMEGRPVEYRAGRPFIGATVDVFQREGTDHVGELQAWSLRTGQRVWTHELPTRFDSVLATAGNLVLADSGGTLFAFDALSGEPLWRYAMEQHRSRGVAMSYAVGGVQYIALQFQPRSVSSAAGSVVVAFSIDDPDCGGLAVGKALLMASREPMESAQVVTVSEAEDKLIRQLLRFDDAAGSANRTRVAGPERIAAPVCNPVTVAGVAAFAQVDAQVDASRRVPRRELGRYVLGIAGEHHADAGADERERGGDLRCGAATSTRIRSRLHRSRALLGGRKDVAVLVRKGGFEPPRAIGSPAPQAGASAVPPLPRSWAVRAGRLRRGYCGSSVVAESPVSESSSVAAGSGRVAGASTSTGAVSGASRPPSTDPGPRWPMIARTSAPAMNSAPSTVVTRVSNEAPARAPNAACVPPPPKAAAMSPPLPCWSSTTSISSRHAST